MQDSWQEIQALYQHGEMERAKKASLAWVIRHPQDVTALHFLGMLYAEQEDLTYAEEYLAQAYNLNVEDATVALHYANILKAQKKYSQAMQVLFALHDVHPKFAAIYNNLGTLYFAEEKWQDAITAFQTALQLQADFIDAYYNLLLTFNKLNRKMEAKQVLDTLLALTPEHVGGLFQLGCFYMQENNYLAAIEPLAKIAERFPNHFETQTNLATCLFKLGRLKEAKKTYLNALALKKDDVQIYFNLAVIESQFGNLFAAENYYLKALTINPDNFSIQYNLGVLLMKLQKSSDALQHFYQALKVEPDNVVVQHLINVIMQNKKITSAPLEYIRSLFDSYAYHYDAHMLNDLHYQLPELMFAAIQQFSQVAYQQWRILDLGCGTGLCGESFKYSSNYLVGVDIAQQMLDVAQQKNIYDELILSDIFAYLKNQLNHWNLILAGDVLGYVGDLNEFFPLVKQALTSSGYFIFSTEIEEQANYRMTSSGRFAYQRDYLEQLMKKNHFTLVSYQQITLRTQQEQPVFAYLYVLKKD